MPLSQWLAGSNGISISWASYRHVELSRATKLFCTHSVTLGFIITNWQRAPFDRSIIGFALLITGPSKAIINFVNLPVGLYLVTHHQTPHFSRTISTVSTNDYKSWRWALSWTHFLVILDQTDFFSIMIDLMLNMSRKFWFVLLVSITYIFID